jgi:hypothetical protein
MPLNFNNISEIEAFQKACQATHRLFQNLEKNDAPTYSLQFDTTFAKLPFVKKGLAALSYPAEANVKSTLAFSLIQTDEKITAIAQQSGFLILLNGVIDLLPIVWFNHSQTTAWAFSFSSTDLTEIWLNDLNVYFTKIQILPQIHGSEVQDFLKQSLGFSAQCISRGKEAVPPIHSSLEYIHPQLIEQVIDPHQNIDFKSLSPFKDISQDDALFKITPKIEGVAGLDIFGQTINGLWF